jgi:hypothetical protein
MRSMLCAWLLWLTGNSGWRATLWQQCPSPWQRYSARRKISATDSQTGATWLCCPYSADRFDSNATQNPRNPTGTTQGHPVAPARSLSAGKVSPTPKALSLQGRSKVGLILAFEGLNACVLSTGMALFVQNQRLMVGLFPPGCTSRKVDPQAATGRLPCSYTKPPCRILDSMEASL